jgi:hypothetical protein
MTTLRTVWRRAAPALAALTLAASAGCAAGKGTLTGKVTYNGKPVTSGTVQVFLADGSTRTGEIAPTGAYSIADVPAGEVKIGVSSPNPKKRYEDMLSFAKTEEQRKAVQTPDPEQLKTWVAIPDALGQPDTSGLTATVKKGDTPHDIALTGPAASPAGPGQGGPTLPSRPSVRP